MPKIISSSFALIALSLFALTGCSKNDEFLKTSQNELLIADNCRNSNRNFEMDCYDLISYKNSFAQLRLGLNAQLKGNFEEAVQRLNIAKQKGNIYANAPLSELYKNGFAVPANDKQATKLLEEVKDIEPIAAFKLSFYYLDKGEVDDAIELLTYAAKNNVKAAQLELSKLYKNGEFIQRDLDMSDAWNEEYEQNATSFTNKIYGH